MTSQPPPPQRTGRDGTGGTGEAGRVVFRPGVGRGLAVGWWVLAAVLAGDLLLRGSAAAALVGVPLLAFTAALAHALFWYPAVAVDEDGIDLVNVLRSVRLPWSSVVDLDTRWALTVETDGARWTSWAAPASGRRIRPVSRRDTPWAEPGAAGIAGSRAPGSSAGEAAVLVGTRWQTWRDRPARDAVRGAGSPRVTWNRAVLASLGATGLASAAVVLVVTSG